MHINITNYLNESEIKEILSDELRNQVRIHFSSEDNTRRLISNLSYQVVYDEVDKLLPGFQDLLVSKIVDHINNATAFNLFDYHYTTGEAKSLGAKIIEQTVRENKDTIRQKVIDQIQNRDYSEDAWNKFERLAEEFTSNIYDFVELIRTSKSTK